MKMNKTWFFKHKNSTHIRNENKMSCYLIMSFLFLYMNIVMTNFCLKLQQKNICYFTLLN